MSVRARMADCTWSMITFAYSIDLVVLDRWRRVVDAQFARVWQCDRARLQSVCAGCTQTLRPPHVPTEDAARVDDAERGAACVPSMSRWQHG